MAKPDIFYDEEGDVLYISFVRGETGTGLDLNDHVLLRVDKKTRQAVGITVISFSILASRSELGDSFPLTGLDELSPASRELALEILRKPPVSDYFTLSATESQTIPITMLNADKLVARAA